MISGLFIYDAKGDILMSKLYRVGIKRNVADVFRIQVLSAPRAQELRSPVLTLGSTSFVYIRSGSLWICAVCRSNHDCAAIMEFLYKLEGILGTMTGAEYKNVPPDSSLKNSSGAGRWYLTEQLILDHFADIFDVLDEMIEYGFPISTNSDDMRLSNGGSLKVSSILGRDSRKSSSILGQLTPSSTTHSTARALPEPTNTPWRPQGIKYRKNEIFVKVEERLHALIEGTEVLRLYVDGQINIKNKLSGMPECCCGLGDNVVVDLQLPSDAAPGEVYLQDARFHESVSLKEMSPKRQINSIPPDKDFTLMLYKCQEGVLLPFYVNANVTMVGNRVLFKVRLLLELPDKMTARDVVLKVEAPPGVVQQIHQALHGKVRWHSEENAFRWRINKFTGLQKHDFTAEVDVLSMQNWLRPPMSLDFHVDMFLLLGISVKYLKVKERLNYKTVKWVEYVTQAGNYEIRY